MKKLCSIFLIALLQASGYSIAQTPASTSSASGSTDNRINRRCPDATLATDPAAPCVGEVLNDRAQVPPAADIVTPASSGLAATDDANRTSSRSTTTPVIP